MAARQRGSPPPILSTAFACQRWNTLPEAGGYYDQDVTTMSGMNVLLNIYRTVERVGNLKGHAIHQLTESERALLRYLMDEGISVN